MKHRRRQRIQRAKGRRFHGGDGMVEFEGSSRTFTSDLGGSTPCPFCYGRFDVGSFEDLIPAVIHSQPACQTYIDKDVTEYLRAVNAAKRGALS